MVKKKVGIFSAGERSVILTRPFKQVLRGKELQHKKWCNVWLAAKNTYKEQFGKPDFGNIKGINNLYMKQDKYATQLRVLQRCPEKEENEMLTEEELTAAEHVNY